MQGIEAPVLISAIVTLGGLLLLTFRLFLNGTLLSRTTVPREDYEKQVTIAASYADRFGEQTKAVQTLTSIVEKQAGQIEVLVRERKTAAVPSRVRSNRKGA